MAGRIRKQEKARFLHGNKYKKANVAGAEYMRGKSEGGEKGRDKEQVGVGFKTKGQGKLYQSAVAIVMLQNKSPQHSVA